MGNSGEFLGNREKRCPAGVPHLAFVAYEEVAKGHVQWRNPDFKARWGANHAPAVEGVGDAISARIAEERNRVLAPGIAEG